MAMGKYAAEILSLGFKTPFSSLLDITNDPAGLALKEAPLPKRIRLSKEDSSPWKPQATCMATSQAASIWSVICGPCWGAVPTGGNGSDLAP